MSGPYTIIAETRGYAGAVTRRIVAEWTRRRKAESELKKWNRGRYKDTQFSILTASERTETK